MRGTFTTFLLSSLVLAASSCALGADYARGNVSFDAHASPIKYGWLVRGPDEMNRGKIVLRMYLSSVDIGNEIKACRTLSCADSALKDGAMVDFSDTTYLAYALRLNGERLQYSGGTNVQAFTLSTNEPGHLAGKLHIDDSAFGGGKVDAVFDLTLTSTFETVR
jgi:hypothetical protein